MPGDHLQLPPDGTEDLARTVGSVVRAEDRQQTRPVPGQRGIDGAGHGRYDGSARSQCSGEARVHQAASVGGVQVATSFAVPAHGTRR